MRYIAVKSQEIEIDEPTLEGALELARDYCKSARDEYVVCSVVYVLRHRIEVQVDLEEPQK